MANVKTNSYQGRYLKLTVIEENISIEDNTSTLKWTLESIGGSSTYYSIYGCKVVVNGITVHNSGTTDWSTERFPAKKGSVSGTLEVIHNVDGASPDISFSLTGSVYNNSPKTYNGSLTLSTIPRASSIGVLDANIGASTNITINKTSQSFFTSLYYRVVGNQEWINIADKTSNQVYAWTVPTSLYSLIPNDKTIQCEFKADTYNYDDDNDEYVLIGTSETVIATFTALGSPIINSANSIDINNTTVALTGDSSKMIRYASNVKISISATAQNSSAISSIKVNGYDVTNNEITFLNSSTNSFVIDVTDSRGYVTSQTITMDMVDYIPIKINSYEIERNQNTDGKIKISYEGVFYNGNFGASNNSLTAQYRYKEKGGTFCSWINLTPTISSNSFSQSNFIIDNFDYQKQFEFELRAVDILGQDEIVGIPIKKGEPTWNWDDTKFNVNVPIKKDNVDLDNIYLKLIGGILTGDLTMPNASIINLLSAKDGVFSNSLKLNNKDVLTTDDLPEIGSNSDGKYIKYPNGLLICRNTIEDNYVITTAWGSLYEPSSNSTAGSTTFPIPFVSKPNLTATQVANGKGGILRDIDYDENGIHRVNFTRPNSSSSTILKYSYIAIGLWK